MEAIATTKIEHYLREIVARLKPLKPYKIVLFGSHATGTAHKDSDIDLLVVTNDDYIPRNFREKMDVHLKVARLLFDIRSEIPVDLLVHTKPMFERFIELDSMFCREINLTGKVIYESDHKSVA